MNILLIVVDSLRRGSLPGGLGPQARAPFLESLGQQSLCFERAYSTECWTLPAHMSMFTGLLPSEHRAHFQTMAYVQEAPTIAELLAEQGYATELITRNSMFDGSLSGVTRGFQRAWRPMAEIPTEASPLLGLFALAKPRVRRLMRESGFFNELQKGDDGFFWTLARLGMPADHLALDLALARLRHHRQTRQPYFLFLNLYDVHAPYSPSATSPMWPLNSWENARDNFRAALALPKISSHAYLRRGFRVSKAARAALLRRYHAAIELMDRKLEQFFAHADDAGLLDDTLLVLTSDHGEGFGEHGLYLHDASVFDTHLHVPLWVRLPTAESGTIQDVVSTRDLFGLFRRASLGAPRSGTILDAEHRGRNPIALAEHFYYPHGADVLPQYRRNQSAIIAKDQKLVASGSDFVAFHRQKDPGEVHPEKVALGDFLALCRGEGLSATTEGALYRHLEPDIGRAELRPEAHGAAFS